MPLFKKSNTTTTAPPPAAAPAPAPARTSTSSNRSSGGGGGFFSSHRRSGSHSPTNTTSTIATTPTQQQKTSSNPISRALNRTKVGSSVPEDPSITAARQRVMGAERAERDADRALVAARASVRDARAEVGRLEAEAEEDARLARLKQGQAKDLNKRAKPLGRHG